MGGTKRATPPLPTRNIPVQVFYGNMAITSHYVSRLRAEIGADLHRDFLQVKYNWSDQQWSLRAEIGADLHRGFLQVKYNWSDQQWCHIA